MEKETITKPLRVLFLLGGLPHYFKFLLNKMNQQTDLEVLLVLPGEGGATLGSGVHESREGAGFETFELEEYRAWYGKAAFRGLRPLLEAEKPDVLVVGWPYILQFFFNPALPRALRKNNIRLVYRDIPFNVPPYGQARAYFRSQQLRNEAGESGVQKGWKAYWSFLLLTEIRKRYLHLADALIFYADIAYDLMATYGIPRERIFITANSPDTDRLLATFNRVRQGEPVLPPNPYRLIHVGRLVKWKRVDLLLEAVDRLKEAYPQIELVVVGFGPEEDALKRQAAALQLNDRVQFTGGVYDEDLLGAYLHASAVYVLAGMGGLFINDAMCFAKPVICSEADGTEKRLVREGFNGLYFENGSAADLARAIGFFMEDPNRARTFGENSLKIIQDEVNIHTVLQEYRRAFRYAVGAGNRSRRGHRLP